MTSRLAGLRVVVTRAADQAEPWLDTLRAAGAVPILAPAIRVVPTPGGELDAALERIGSGHVHWVIFTSRNTVDVVLERMSEIGRSVEDFASTRVAAVGHVTAMALESRGIAVELVPDEQTAAGLVAALTKLGVAGQRCWLPQGNLARNTLADGLRAAGAEVETTVVYRTEPNDRLDPEVRRQIVDGNVDVLTFASPSAVDSFLRALGDDRTKVRSIPAVAIGPTTADAIRDHDLTLAAVADDASVAGMIRAIERTMAERQPKLQTS